MPSIQRLDRLANVEDFAPRFDAQASQYQYEPLPSSACIRLLSIQQSSGSHDFPYSPELEVRLHTFLRGDYPPYAAVSYMWGKNPRLYTIKVNGRAFPVRSNLFALLQSFTVPQVSPIDAATSMPYRYEYLWVDALCIDQSNLGERNSQVARMGSIYAEASHTLVWLGDMEEQEFELIACNLAKAHQDFAARRDLVRNNPEHRAWGRASYGPDQGLGNEFITRSNIGTQQSPIDYAKIDCLQNHPYWGRAWIVQENLFAKSVVLKCGQTFIALRTFEVYGRYNTVFSGNIWNHRKRHQNPKYPNGVRCPLVTLLRRYGQHDCEDPRDKIYALLPLATADSHHIEIDYSKSVQDLFLEVTESLLLTAYLGKEDAIAMISFLYHQLMGPQYPIGSCPFSNADARCFRVNIVNRGSIVPVSRENEARDPSFRFDILRKGSSPKGHDRASAIDTMSPMIFSESEHDTWGYDFDASRKWQDQLAHEHRSIQPTELYAFTSSDASEWTGYRNLPTPETSSSTKSFFGLASIPIQAGMEVWQFYDTQKGFVVRRIEETVYFVGSAFISLRGQNPMNCMYWSTPFHQRYSDHQLETLQLTHEMMLIFAKYAGWARFSTADSRIPYCDD